VLESKLQDYEITIASEMQMKLNFEAQLLSLKKKKSRATTESSIQGKIAIMCKFMVEFFSNV
jgi:hypothetical protein